MLQNLRPITAKHGIIESFRTQYQHLPFAGQVPELEVQGRPDDASEEDDEDEVTTAERMRDADIELSTAAMDFLATFHATRNPITRADFEELTGDPVPEWDPVAEVERSKIKEVMEKKKKVSKKVALARWAGRLRWNHGTMPDDYNFEILQDDLSHLNKDIQCHHPKLPEIPDLYVAHPSMVKLRPMGPDAKVDLEWLLNDLQKDEPLQGQAFEGQESLVDETYLWSQGRVDKRDLAGVLRDLFGVRSADLKNLFNVDQSSEEEYFKLVELIEQKSPIFLEYVAWLGFIRSISFELATEEVVSRVEAYIAQICLGLEQEIQDYVEQLDGGTAVDVLSIRTSRSLCELRLKDLKEESSREWVIPLLHRLRRRLRRSQKARE
ncbi:hypothetical protein T439DRAFT_170965 [Meredithblackwellia eburnea MCA 4105]